MIVCALDRTISVVGVMSSSRTRLESDRDFRPWRFVDRGGCLYKDIPSLWATAAKPGEEITLPVDGRLIKARVYAVHDTQGAGTKVRQADAIEI